MVIRHLKHDYLIKEQFFEENEFNHFRFFFSRILDFLFLWWGFLLFGFIQISWMHNGNIIILFFIIFLFRLGTLVMGGCSLDGDVDCFDKVLLGPKWFKLFLSKERVLLRLGLSWDFWSKVFQVVPVKRKVWVRLNCFKAMKSCFWINMPLDINREWKR